MSDRVGEGQTGNAVGFADRRRLEFFSHGQRVLVTRVEGERIPFTWGTVYRLRRADDRAWVKLERRLDMLGVHPFPADDEGGRGAHVLANPEDCYV